MMWQKMKPMYNMQYRQTNKEMLIQDADNDKSTKYIDIYDRDLE